MFMSIQGQVKRDMLISMKAKDSSKTSLLKVVMGEFDRENKEVSDERALKIIRGMYENAVLYNNDEDADILNVYLPQIFDTKRTREVVIDIISTGEYSTMKDMGRVMKDIRNSEYSTQIDGKISSSIVKELLSR